MADEAERENSGEIELYGELGVLPKVGVKVRLARKARFEQVIDAAASHAELDRDQLEDRIFDSDDQVRDVVAMAALRAEQVDDDEYVDLLSRLIAGALDAAAIDELAFVTSEITKLEPVHLRALLSFFFFGREGHENADPDLSPREAAWATNRYRADREVAYLLKMSRETTSQVLLRLDRDGFIHLNGGPAQDGEPTSGPRDWAGRVVSMLFPAMRVEFRNTIDGSVVPEGVPSAPAKAEPTRTVEPAPAKIPTPKDRRAIAELESEIKNVEKRRASFGLMVGGSDDEWLATMKRRLRRVDPDNPWAYGD